MKVSIRKSFEKDSARLPPPIQRKLSQLIIDLEEVKKLSDIISCKKLTGHKDAYRIRLGSHRIGFFFEKETIELVRILDRKSIYRFFP
ncbi:MAG: hypothetical protein ABJA90_09755 [Ginsengibacter sp.]